MTTLLEAALDLSRRGMHVFALQPKEKIPATKHGVLDATIDEAAIREMWREPERNVAVATGRKSGVVVVDVDGDEGEQALAALERAHEKLPATPEVRTGRGRHLYFAHPNGGQVVRNSASRLGQGLDTRGEGGYCVAPPSVHPSGARYSWVRDLEQQSLAVLPAWIIDALTAKKDGGHNKPPGSSGSSREDAYVRAALARECGAILTAGNGHRNHRLNTAAFALGQLVGGGVLDHDLACHHLMQAALAAGLGERETEGTVRSGLKAGQREPRGVPEHDDVGARQDRAPPPPTDDDFAAPSSGTGHGREPGVSTASDSWPELIQLGAVSRLPPFPIDSLPDWLRAWALAQARATQTPPAMAALLGLAAVATCCAGRMRVCVRRGWEEPLNIFVAAVQPPGSRKSAIFRAATAALARFERREVERLAPEIAKRTALYRVAEQVLKTAEAKAAKAGAEERLVVEHDLLEAVEDARRAEAAIPVAPRLVCGDVTGEQLARLLAQQGGRMAVMDSEGVGPFSIMLGRYAKDGAPSIDVYLRGHAGDTIRVDRVGREPVLVEAPALTLALTVQPEVLRQLGEQKRVRGLGLLARFLWCVPPSLIGSRDTEPAEAEPAIVAAYDAKLEGLLHMQPGKDGEPRDLNLSPGAWAKLREMMDVLEPQLGEGGELQYVADWAAKLHGATARVAGLLHAAELGFEPWAVQIDAGVMSRAVEIGWYLLAHARHALGIVDADPLIASAEVIVQWLRRAAEGEFRQRDLQRALAARFQKAAELTEPLELLTERGYIRLKEQPVRKGPGRSPSPVYEVNPAALAPDRIASKSDRMPGATQRVDSVSASNGVGADSVNCVDSVLKKHFSEGMGGLSP